VFSGEGSFDVWTYDVATRRLAKELGNVRNHAWTPDGTRLLAHRPSLPADIVSLKLDGSGAVETLVRGDRLSGPSFLTKDGRTLVFHEVGRETGYDLMIARTDGSEPYRPFIRTPQLEAGARLHPNERWVAYATNLDGREDVFVTRFPEADIKIPVTIDGGREPVWSVDGKELFYRQDTKLFAVRLRPGTPIAFDQPRLLFDIPYYQDGGPGNTQYDVAPDGRFLMMKAPERETPYFGVILNWADALAAAISRR
jgi:serine/threonine-protein kinase